MNVSNIQSSRNSFRECLAIVGRVVIALVLRENKTRFGAYQLGYVWVFVEPIAYIGFFVVVRTFLARTTPFGESIVLFLVTGLLSFRVFTGVTAGIGSAISANKALLTYPPVKINDVIMSRAVLETIVGYMLFALFFIGMAMFANSPIFVHPQKILASIAVLTLLSVGIGTFNAITFVLVPIWSKVFAILRLPLLLLSGIFYVPNSMPPVVISIIQWNPLVHCIEWMRTGVYLTYDPMLDPLYVILFGTTTLVGGLALERIYRYRLLAS